jgi:TetR/AcrR family transcriptional repressor of nem operon
MVLVMRTSASTRTRLKRESLARVLGAAARRIRREGLGGASIASVMADAGLTHGAFYSHFSSKEELEVAAFTHAITIGRPQWIPPMRGEGWSDRRKRLAKRYLTIGHREDLENSCGFAALASEAAHASAEFRNAYESELRGSLAAICGTESPDAAHFDDALALMVVLIGGLTLARAVPDDALSDRVLRVARRAAIQLADATTDRTSMACSGKRS